MKILMVNKFLHPAGGAETYIFKLGEALNAYGYEVQYFGMEHEKRCVNNRVNSYTSTINFHGLNISQLTYPLKIVYSYEAMKKIRLVLEDFQPDVLHLNNFNFQLTPSIILEARKWEKQLNRSLKIVLTAHDYQLVCPNHMMYNPQTRQSCHKCIGGKFINCAKGKCIHNSVIKSLIGSIEGYFWKAKGVYKHIDTIICPSRFIKEKMDTNPLFASKTIVFHNFMDKIQYDEAIKKDYALYFGRYSVEKGIRTLLSVCKELPDVSFVFAGSGPLEDEIKDVPLIKNVGLLSGDALKKVIKEARFSVYPSEWYENCPFSVIESQKYGTPVLGANIGGITELIQIGKTGELFQSGNASELKMQIKRLWNNKKLTQTYNNNCKKIKFDSIEEYCKKIINIYQT